MRRKNVTVSDRPKKDQCCICRRALPEKIVEEVRPTGWKGEHQTWYYCEGCWKSHQWICRKTNQEWSGKNRGIAINI
jgi:hypothetical protein